MQTLLHDIRYAVRVLLKRPGFTLVAVFLIALGIGATTAIFSVVDSVLLKPLSFSDSDHLMMIGETNPQKGSAATELSFPNLSDVQQQSNSFEGIAAYHSASYVMEFNGVPSRVTGTTVSSNLFSLLRAKTAQGRTFLPQEDSPGADTTMVVSQGFWQRYFAGQALAGQSVNIDSTPYTIVGVMPADFQFPNERTEMWLALGSEGTAAGMDSYYRNRSVHFLNAIGRLKSGVTQSQAAAELATIFAGIQQQHPGEDPGHGVRIISLRASVVGDVKTALLVLFGAVGFVLLIACANVANLLLARAAARHREMAIRVALGAGRWHLVRQSLTESLLLSAAGGALGLLLATWAIRWLVPHLPDQFPRASEIGVNVAVLGFACFTSLLAGVLFGLVPAVQSPKTDVNDALKAGGKGDDAGRGKARRVLVVAEVALSLMLLMGAGLMLKSFWRLVHVDPGFEPDNLLTMNVSLPNTKYQPGSQSVANFFRQLQTRLASFPGVESVSGVSRLPVSGSAPRGELMIEGHPFAQGEAPPVGFRRILPNYFHTMGIPVLQGRDFDNRDGSGGQPDVIIVNRKLAERFWPNGDALGKRLRLGAGQRMPGAVEPWLTIIGVVGDVRDTGLDAEPDLVTYEPHAKRAWSVMTLVVRTHADPASVAPALHDELRKAEPQIMFERVSTMASLIHDSIAPQRMNLALLAAFAVAALLLAVVGVYGVVSYLVTLRTREIGIRVALGAQVGDVIRLVLGQGTRLVVTGVAIGLVGSFGVTRLLTKLLYGVSPTDAVTFVAVSLFLTASALVACLVPAARAAKVDPVIAIRYE